MAISFYEKGDLSSGFYGFKVAVVIRRKYHQKWLSMKLPSENIPIDLWFKYQETRAKYYEARWLARSAATQYIDFIKTNHKSTKPFRGLGFHGMTIGIGRGNRCLTDQCYFQVNKRGSATRIWITKEVTLSQAWKKAITLWGESFGIRTKDIQHKLNSQPSPDIFKHLRVHLNQNEGKDYPPSVLRHVYAEQRKEIELKKASVTATGDSPVDLSSFHSSLEREISRFLEKEAKGNPA